MYVRKKKSWDESQTYCTSHGSQLISSHNRYDTESIIEYLNDLGRKHEDFSGKFLIKYSMWVPDETSVKLALEFDTSSRNTLSTP